MTTSAGSDDMKQNYTVSQKNATNLKWYSSKV